MSFSISATIKTRPDISKIIKQLDYGTAVGLTKTAKEAQAAVIDAIDSRKGGVFTIRNNWLTSPIGIKITPATKGKLQAEVRTSARFLPVHEEGGTKFPLNKHIAVPTQFAQPNKGARIKAADKPRALIDSGKAAIVTNDKGTTILYAHRGPRNGWVPMYILTPKAKEKKVDIWAKPIRKVIDKKLALNIAREQQIALANMR